jgi:glyoxylase-like metal-dependent hydrolase (beta-lactamase superfamily II)
MLPDAVHPLPLPVAENRTLTAAAVELDTGVLLVDTGLPDTTDLLGEALADAGIDFSDVALVLLTHHDGDHAGGLAAVRERTGAPVLAHERAAPFVRGGRDPLKSDGERYPPAPVEVELDGGETFHTPAGPARLVHTPGHAPGHVSVHFPEASVLLAGDALTAEGGELAGPKPQFTPDRAEAERSVRRLAGLAVETVLCYHGGVVDPADVSAL